MDTIKLILKDRIFSISTSWLPFKDINPEIYSILISDKKYYIKSNVNENVLQSFLSYLINKETPEITINNFSDFQQLSDEFDTMKDTIELYKKYISNSTFCSLLKKNHFLKKEKNKESDFLTKNALKYHQIIHHLFANNGFDPDSNFIKSKDEILKECCRGNCDKVDLFTHKQITEKGFVFILNENEHTATVFHNNSSKGDIFIPKSITYKSQEYLITEIADEAFLYDQNIKSIQFPEDSNLQKIGKYSFSHSSIEKIKIPSHVKEIGIAAFSDCDQLKTCSFSENSELKIIKEQTFSNGSIECLYIPSSVEQLETCWCLFANNLNEIIVSPNNKNFCNYNEFVIGKSEKENDVYDILYFGPRKTKKVIIPSFIKQIAPYCFYQCNSLTTIEFEKNSELYLIGSSSFSYTSIQSILIPSNVIHIEKFAFANCELLENVEFEKDSALCSIEEFAFCNDLSLTSISLPNHLKKMFECVFSSCENLEKVEFSEKSELKSIGQSVFSKTPINYLSIPSSIEEIEDKWCREIDNLTDIKIFPSKKPNIIYYNNTLILGKTNTESDEFDVLLFMKRNIKKLKIPSFIKIIAPYALSDCGYLEEVEFEEKSKLEIIDQNAFAYSNIKQIKIPPNVKIIKKDSFYFCSNLKSFELSKDSEIQSIGKYSFCNSPLEKISIPSNFTNFQKGWCFGVENLNDINIIKCKEQNISYYNNSFLLQKSDINSDVFDILLFARRNINKIIIPSFIKQIGPYAFSQCKQIKIFEFENNSQLKIIDDYSFSYSSLKKIVIPKNVIKISESVFVYSSLKRIEFENNCILESIGKSSFQDCSLESIIIPSNVSLIGNDTFSYCNSFKIIEIAENSKLKNLKTRLFQNSGIVIIMISANTHIFK